MGVIKVAYTGGPCGLKSTGMVDNAERLKKLYPNFTPFIIPEVATELLNSGIRIGKDGVSIFEFQKLVLDRQLEYERKFTEKAQNAINPVLLCDRGKPDALGGYVSEEEVKLLYGYLMSNPVKERDLSYKGVIHCVTAAIGAFNHYTTENNPARYETPKQAAIRDWHTLQAWLGHPHRWIISNVDEYDKQIGEAEKKERMFFALCRILGIPEPVEIERKFLVEQPNLSEIKALLDTKVVPIYIQQRYLRADKKLTRRIRKRGQDEHFIYYYEEKKRKTARIRSETGELIDKNSYERYSKEELDSRYEDIEKIRNYFVWRKGNQFFQYELDFFLRPERNKNLTIIEVEMLKEDDPVDFPPCIKVIKEVTGNPEYSNKNLAKKIPA